MVLTDRSGEKLLGVTKETGVKRIHARVRCAHEVT